MTSWQGHLLAWYFRAQRWFQRPPESTTISQRRGSLVKTASGFKPLVPCEVSHVDAGGVPADWITSQGVISDNVILFFHGGYYHSGSPETHRPLAANLAHAASARILSVDYRLAPEHPFPAAIEDAQSSYRWLLSQDVPPSRIAVAGDSAGGGLGLALMLALRDQGLPLPSAGVFLCPWVDLAQTTETWATRSRKDFILAPWNLSEAAGLYLAGVDPRTPLASPYYADLRGLPPVLIQVGTEEILLTEVTSLAEKAQAAGVKITLEVWPGQQHDWHFAGALLPEAMQAIEHVGNFLRNVWSG
jgi:monoterpene epsilon-lactone hydrolase